jgi:hypothetical protein
MRTPIVAATMAALVLAGIVGMMVHREQFRSRHHLGEHATRGANGQPANPGKGQRVDLPALVAGEGHALVMFTADF